MKHLVFVGAGHAHLRPLQETRTFVERGLRVTLIAPGRFWYSGMGPGMVSGFYQPSDDTVDAAALVTAGGGRYLRDKVVAIDPHARSLQLAGGESISYDALSINIGSEVPLERIPGAAEFALPVKPIKNLLELRERVLARKGGAPLRAIVIGGGAAGSEVGTHIFYLLQKAGCHASVTIIAAEERLLTEAPPRASAILEKYLRGLGVTIRCGKKAERVTDGAVILESGEELPFDLLVSATGVRAPALLRESGLPCADDGSMRVNQFLQVNGHPEIFGAGDCVCFGERCLPRIGVYAVRQGPVLSHNLLAFLTGDPLQKFEPQKNYLLILNLGDGTGLLTRGSFTFRSRLAFWLKDWLDRRFVRQFQKP